MSIRMWRTLVAIFVGTLLVALSPDWATAQQADVDASVRAE